AECQWRKMSPKMPVLDLENCTRTRILVLDLRGDNEEKGYIMAIIDGNDSNDSYAIGVFFQRADSYYKPGWNN
ncbi:unnamed protein product, partial [marine sediment metagenome]